MRGDPGIGCAGFCRDCGRVHSLPAAPAYQACLELMAELAEKGSVAQNPYDASADLRLSTSSLFGGCRGKMFGVMVARSSDAETVVLRAFSGRYNGIWQVPGWVGPVFDLAAFHCVHDAEEKKIKELGRRLEEEVHGAASRRQLLLLRKQLSRQLMTRIHGLYRLKNFSGQVASLEELFPQDKGIPTGTGDCCAPKLLQYAVEHRLVPFGLAEFYWGKSNRSGSRQHGIFYQSCQSRCYLILGFMLCGLEGR